MFGKKVNGKALRTVSRGSCFLMIGFVISLSLNACKTTKTATSNFPAPRPQSTKDLTRHLENNKIDVEWLSAKSKVSFKSEVQSQKGTLNIRLRKDSVIWMNVKKLGIEGARILITPDSIYVIDRIHKQYAISDFSLIQEKYHLPADFNSLQNLILGNPLLISGVELTTQIDSTQYHLSSSSDLIPTRDYWLNGLTKTLTKMIFLDYRNNRKVKVELSKYQALDQYKYFSYFRSLNMSSPETGDLTIDINISKVEINVPKSIRFEIPEHYTRIN